MELHRPEFIPSPSLSRADMEALQQRIAATAAFETTESLSLDDCLVAGVDQAFRDESAVSAIVVRQNNETIEETHATAELEIPYIPGLLAFREGPPILEAFRTLDTRPDIVLFDGSGRIHYRQAGLATHIGAILNIPSVGIAKQLLCGTPRESVDNLPAGRRIPIEANAEVDAPPGTVLGYAVQTRQYQSGPHRVNPLYVSPGHLVGAKKAVEITQKFTREYKLPEPIRRADQLVGEIAAETP